MKPRIFKMNLQKNNKSSTINQQKITTKINNEPEKNSTNILIVKCYNDYNRREP